MFGWLRATWGERDIARFRTQKTGALLGYLAYHMGRAHAREELIEMLWPGCDMEDGRRSLSVALSSIRHQMEPPGYSPGIVLMADRYSVQFNPATVTTDVREFEAALTAGARGVNEVAAEHLAAAARLYGGPLLPGYYEDWIQSERERLAEAHVAALDRLISLRESAGDVRGAIQMARHGLRRDPLRESLHRSLMQLYVVAGEPAAALRQYRELERVLGEELGVRPDETTRGLAREIESRMAGPLKIVSPAVEGAREEPDEADGRVAMAGGVPPLKPMPSGTVTYLLMALEGARGHEGGAAEGFRQRAREAIQRHGGRIMREAGDAFRVAYARASDAVETAVRMQRAAGARNWRVRTALHTGEVGFTGGEASGPALEQARKVLAAGHAGQIICTEPTAGLIGGDPEPGWRLIGLGPYFLFGRRTPVRLFQINFPDMPVRDFPPPAARPGYGSTLPLQVTRFFGRGDEMREIASAILSREARLVTITGTGGTGKTRLSLETARMLNEPFRGALWFVPLADLTDAGLIPDAILSLMREERLPGQSALETLGRVVSEQRTLLILDNFEHLAAAGGPIIANLLERAASLQCLVTTRRPLGIAGERQLALRPLPLPRPGMAPAELVEIDSVRLFVDRAQAVKPDFQVTEGNAAALAALCAGLDGLPLALELAAARVQVMTPARMLEQLGERLEWLATKRRGVAERHRTLRGAIEWSYGLLAPDLRAFFAELSIFRGGWTREAAEAVTEQPMALDLLAQLRECSMIETVERAAGMRFRMYESLRVFGAERLAEERRAALARRHAWYFVKVGEQAEPHLRQAEQRMWLDRLADEHENIRVAMQWSAGEGDVEAGLRLANGAWRYWYARGYIEEGRGLLEAVLAKPAPRDEVLARALNCAGAMAYYDDALPVAHRFFEQSLAIYRELNDPRGIAMSLSNLANVVGDQQDFEKSSAYFEESIIIYRQVGDLWGIANNLLNLGVNLTDMGKPSEAIAFLEKSLKILQEIGDILNIAHAIQNMGDAVRQLGDLNEARELYDECLATYRELDHKSGIADCLYRLGLMALEDGRTAEARSLFQEALTLQKEINSKNGSLLSMEALAEVARREGQPERAVILYATVDAQRRAFDLTLKQADAARREAALGELKQQLGRARYGRNWRAGLRLERSRAIAYALGKHEIRGRSH